MNKRLKRLVETVADDVLPRSRRLRDVEPREAAATWDTEAGVNHEQGGVLLASVSSWSLLRH